MSEWGKGAAVAMQREQAEEISPQEQSSADEGTVLEMRALHDRLEILKLSRARTVAQLAQATNTKYCAMLERALSALDVEIKELTKLSRNKT